ncbi:MAG: glycosyltransferase family 39 protein [Bacteroidota bacterium]
MQATTNRKYNVLFYTIFTLLNIVQAASTGLIDDEAYYWVYAKFLDWGYYDHPPMIAVLIRSGGALFHNELGVRLLMIALSTASIFLLEKIVEPKNKKLFYAIILNIAVLQFAGFIAVPDIPLAFFVIVFFYRYKQFLLKPSLLNTFAWGISMALMLYTKYHGVLIIFFVILSNLRMLLRWQVYVAGLFGAILFLPHLIWQYNHGFPSVYYHLWDRNTNAYTIAFTTEYLLGQIALAGPILGWLFLFALVKFRSDDIFKRSLKFAAIGFYLFFLLSSLNGRIEANWTLSILSCIAAIAYFYFVEKIKWHKAIYVSAIASFILVCCIRLILFTGILDQKIPIVNETKGNKKWALAIKNAAQDKPVLFLNSYQGPSKYWFYSGDTGFSINTFTYRQNNYNIWPIGEAYMGKDVALITSGTNDTNGINIETIKGNARLQIEKSLYFENNIIFYVQRKLSLKQNQSILLSGKKYLNNNKFLQENIFLRISDNSNFTIDVPCTKIVLSEDNCDLYFAPVNLAKGKYIGKICIKTSIPGISSLNSNTVTITAE